MWKKYCVLFRSQFAKDTIWLQSGSGARKLLLLVRSIFVARILRPDLYGEYALIYAMFTLVILWTDFGIKKTILTKYSESYAKNDKKEMYNILIFSAKTLGGVMIGLIMLGGVIFPFFGNVLFKKASIGICVLSLCFSELLLVPYYIITAVFQAMLKIKRLVFLEVFCEILRLVVIIIMLGLGFGLKGVISGLVISSAIFSAIAILAYTKFLTYHPGSFVGVSEIIRKWNTVSFKKYFRTSLSIDLNTKLGVLIKVLPVFLLGYLGSAREAGYFKIALYLYGIPLWLFDGLARNLMPKLGQVKGKYNILEFRSHYYKASLYSGIILIIIGGLFVFLMPLLINMLYGNEFLPAVNVAYILSLLFLIMGFAVANESFYIYFKGLRFANIKNTILFVILLPFLYFFARFYLAAGAAIYLVVISYLAVSIDMCYINYALKRIK